MRNEVAALSRSLALVALSCLMCRSATVTVPAGTIVNIRLSNPVSSQKPSGQPVDAVVTVPVVVNGAAAIASGTKLKGKTADVRPASSQEAAATLRLVFDKLVGANGHTTKLSAQLSAVDNIRESVGTDGLITGIVAAETWYGRMNQGLSKLANRNPGLAGLLGAVRDSFVKEVDASITYPPGTDMQIKLTKDLACEASDSAAVVSQLATVPALTPLVNGEPNRTVAGNPPKPSDITNLMFVGSEAALTAAFGAAGWSTAATLDQQSKMETARAIIENRGYHEAPVSILLLDGHPPDLVFQKQTNTFAMRHHIRIWRRPSTFAGAPVWVGAATHDTGIDFSAETHTFTHKIDSNIDLERAKVVNDLTFPGYVAAYTLVERSNLPPNLSNATGDQLTTDGKMAVLQLRDKPVSRATEVAR